eukprot:1149801-Pelagomonas_calceolata.AAC.10
MTVESTAAAPHGAAPGPAAPAAAEWVPKALKESTAAAPLCAAPGLAAPVAAQGEDRQGNTGPIGGHCCSFVCAAQGTKSGHTETRGEGQEQTRGHRATPPMMQAKAISCLHAPTPADGLSFVLKVGRLVTEIVARRGGAQDEMFDTPDQKVGLWEHQAILSLLPFAMTSCTTLTTLHHL